jgi:hypothetical protein
MGKRTRMYESMVELSLEYASSAGKVGSIGLGIFAKGSHARGRVYLIG